MVTTAQELFDEHFETEVLETVESHPDIGQWSVAGRAKKVPEDLSWWRQNGPKMVQNWIDWRATSGWVPWRTPDGVLASELDIETHVDRVPCTCGHEFSKNPHEFHLEWCPVKSYHPVPLKMYIDLVMVSQPARQLVIVDLKTGARTPDSDLQLGVYRLGIMKKYGIDIRLGAYWMARKGEMGEVFDLSRLKPELLELWFLRFREATDEGIFIPNPTSLCRACAMRDYCTAYGGSKQHLDPDYGGTNV
jgi:CRISPR/Cas system-associated exonuclease Cas4 (RecB family)